MRHKWIVFSTLDNVEIGVRPKHIVSTVSNTESDSGFVAVNTEGATMSYAVSSKTVSLINRLMIENEE